MNLFDKEASVFLMKVIEDSFLFLEKNKFYIILSIVIYVLLSIIRIKNEELKIRREAEGKGKVLKRNGKHWCYMPYVKPLSPKNKKEG